MTRIFTISENINNMMTFESFMILFRVRNQNATINNKVRKIRKILDRFELDPVN